MNCGEITMALKKCVDAHPEYYGKLSEAPKEEKEAEVKEEVSEVKEEPVEVKEEPTEPKDQE